MLDAARSRVELSGSILVSERGRVVYSGNFGYADLSRKRPIRPDSAFELASVTKPMTAVAIAMLEERGKLSYDDALSKYFPELPYPGVTIRHLLTHTSGLPDPEQLFRDDWPSTRIANNADVVMRLALLKPPRHFAPGERWRYNTTSYALLGRIVELVSGVSYGAFIRDTMLQPLGMRDSLVFDRFRESPPANLAFGYLPSAIWSDEFVLPETLPRYGYIVPFGSTVGAKGIYSSARDLVRWVDALNEGKLASRASLEKIYTPARLADGSTPSAGGGAGNDVPSRYGMGWFVEQGPDGRTVRHTGDWPGYITCLVHNVDKDQTIVVLSNMGDPGMIGVANAIEAILNGHPYELPKARIGRVVGKTIVASGIEKAVREYRDLKRSRPNDYDFASEDELNALGYALLRAGKTRDAVEVFKLNVESFPGSWNVHDSLGEAYAEIGDRERAIESYRRSVELNPENRGGVDAINRLGPP